jgi:hemerythrin-like domain-containing protein
MMKRDYNHSLVDQLESDHRKIMDLYTEIQNLFHMDAAHSAIKERLNKLKAMLQMHIDFEDSLLYPYLSNGYQHDDEKMTFIEQAGADMLDLASDAFRFIEECANELLFSQSFINIHPSFSYKPNQDKTIFFSQGNGFSKAYF